MSAYHLPLLLALSAAGLGLVVQERLSLPASSPGPMPAAAGIVKDAQAAIGATEGTALPVQLPPLQAFSAVVARPLFSATRRPPVPEPEPEPEPRPKMVAAEPPPSSPPPQTGQFQLIGTIIGENGKNAIMRTRDSGRILRLGERESIRGWRVESIERTLVVVRQGDTTEELHLHDVGAAPGEPGDPAAPEWRPAPTPHEAVVSQGGTDDVTLIRFTPPLSHPTQ